MFGFNCLPLSVVAVTERPPGVKRMRDQFLRINIHGLEDFHYPMGRGQIALIIKHPPLEERLVEKGMN